MHRKRKPAQKANPKIFIGILVIFMFLIEIIYNTNVLYATIAMTKSTTNMARQNNFKIISCKRLE